MSCHNCIGVDIAGLRKRLDEQLRENDRLLAVIGELTRGRDQVTAAKDAAYMERNQCVAALARVAVAQGCDAYLARHEGGEWDDDWRTIVFIELPTGQVSWHIHDNEREAFRFLPRRPAAWDGHSTECKYGRLERWHGERHEDAERAVGAHLRDETPGAVPEKEQEE